MIIICGTSANGGIKSVVNQHIESGIYGEEEVRNVSTHKYESSILNAFLFLGALAKIIFFLIKNEKVKIHCHVSMRGSVYRKMIILKVGKFFGAKTIIHLHGSEFAVFFNGLPPSIKRMIRRAFGSADSVFVLSSCWKDFIDTISDVNSKVVYNYIEDDFSSIRFEEKNHRKFIFLGALGKRKGIFDLLSAMAKLQGEDFHVDICGDGEITAAKEMASRLGLDKKVKFHGWVSKEQARGLLKGASTLLLPSYNEGLPMSIIEGLSAGCLIISTNVGGIAEQVIVGKNGFLVEPGDVDAISDSLRKIINMDLNEREKMFFFSRKHFIDNFSEMAVVPHLKKEIIDS